MLTFIVNPTAGSGYAGKAWLLIEEELQRRGVKYCILHTEYKHSYITEHTDYDRRHRLQRAENS